MSWSDDRKKKEKEEAEAERKRRAQANGYTRNNDVYNQNAVIWDTDKSGGCNNNDSDTSSSDSSSCD